MQNEEELKILSHDPWPGYKKAFKIVFALLTIYMAVILLSAPDGGYIGHGDTEHHDEDVHHDESSSH